MISKCYVCGWVIGCNVIPVTHSYEENALHVHFLGKSYFSMCIGRKGKCVPPRDPLWVLMFEYMGLFVRQYADSSVVKGNDKDFQQALYGAKGEISILQVVYTKNDNKFAIDD